MMMMMFIFSFFFSSVLSRRLLQFRETAFRFFVRDSPASELCLLEADELHELLGEDDLVRVGGLDTEDKGLLAVLDALDALEVEDAQDLVELRREAVAERIVGRLGEVDVAFLAVGFEALGDVDDGAPRVEGRAALVRAVDARADRARVEADADEEAVVERPLL